MHIQRPYEEATRVNLFYNPECPLWMPGFELLILQFSKEQSFWTFTTKYVCMVSCSVQFINRFDQKYGMWPLGYKKKEKNRDTKLWRSRLSDHGNNALPLSIPELDLIGGVARGLAEGRSVLARSKPGYVKRYEIYKQLCPWTLLKSLIIKIINLIVWVYSINSCQKWNRIRNIFQLHCNTIEREWGTKQY